MEADIPRVMLAGAASGCGKTTLTCAVLKALKNRSVNVSSFKCGPDYIDPMFHSRVIGAKSRNLDIFMCGEQTVKHLFAENAKNTDFAVMEGVMGMYDGLGGDEYCSSNHLSLLTDTPLILVLNARGASLSLAAQVFGYMKFRRNNIKGVILNRTTEAGYAHIKDMIESQLGVRVYGYMPEVPEAVFESRHLGLITAGEIEDLNHKLNALARECEKTVDIDGLIALGREHSHFSYDDIPIRKLCDGVKISVAQDNAFCFYYEDNFELLRRLGAEIRFFSPLSDAEIPAGTQGLILGGGYPEEHAAAVSANVSMKESIKNAVLIGVPTIAECGGFMYLCKTLRDANGITRKMTGVINADSYMTKTLTRFGYVTLTAGGDNLLCRKGESINAHEFHYSDASDAGCAFTAHRAGRASRACVHAGGTLFAGYPHMHLWGNISFAESFIKKCTERS